VKDKEEETTNSPDMDFEVIHSYTLNEALNDGVLVAFDQPSWPVITCGKSLVVTSAIRESLTDDQIKTVWDKFVGWMRHVRDTLPEEDQLFSIVINGQTVWVIEDAMSFCVMLPTDY